MSDEAPDDANLVARLLAGEEQAFVTLIDTYHARLLRLALGFVADRSVAEEVVQDTWAGVMAALPSFERRASLKTWIFRILVNRARTRGVREKRTVPFSALEDPDDAGRQAHAARFDGGGSWLEPPRPWDDETPERLLLRRETMAILRQAIDALPPGQRAVIVLRDIEGVSSEEVCNILDITETNQRVLLHRARVRLRAALEGHLG